MLHSVLLLLLAFFSTLLVDAFAEDEEAVFLSLAPQPPRARPSEAATRTAAPQRKIDFFIRSPLYLSDSHYTPIVTKIKFFCNNCNFFVTYFYI